MESAENLVRLWNKVSPLILPFDGSASQACVLDVPRRELRRIIEEYRRRAVDTKVTILDGFATRYEEAPECDDITLSALIEAKEGQSCILGDFVGGRRVQFYIWPGHDDSALDAEFVFFADEFFPQPRDEQSTIASFAMIYSLAEMVRSNDLKCECVLSNLEVGDPRIDRNPDSTVVW